jgi:hypothetical protein
VCDVAAIALADPLHLEFACDAPEAERDAHIAAMRDLLRPP